jgi:AMP-polyphosphate phosphotransferase
MFEDAELGHRIDKATYDREVPALRAALLAAQAAIKARADFPVILLVDGVDGGGRSETVNTLTSWLDPRQVEVNGMGPRTDEERQRPEYWRYWRALPAAGSIGIFFGAWYTRPILHTVEDDEAGLLSERIARIQRFERSLAEEGALVVKVWFHLSKAAQKARMQELAADRRTAWRVTKRDKRRLKHYDAYRTVAEEVLQRTSVAWAPWTVIGGTDRRYRELTVGQLLLSAMQQRLAAPATVDPAPALPALPRSRSGRTVLSELDMSARVSSAHYDKELPRLQERLGRLVRHPAFAERSLVAVFEGADAAGKGGAIRRVTAAVDARYVRVVPIGAPTDEERRHPYLWRFWRHLPRHGQLTVFDRSWYGRVLVERVEGLASPYDWQRAYSEINEFEDELLAHGTILVKCWLAISKDEQLRRFRERERTAFKEYKITPEDWRNRKRWPQYTDAVHEMVVRTSTTPRPWTLVAADDKHHARLTVLTTLVQAMERACGVV